MKQFFRFFTLLIVAVVTSVSVKANDLPLPNPVAPVLGNEYYIYNVGTKKFIGQGEAWGTQSCVVEKGLTFVLANEKEDGTSVGINEEGEEIFTLPEGQYWLNSGTSLSVTRWTTDGTVGSGVKGCFSDQGFGSEAAIWKLASVGENTYTLQVPEDKGDYIEGEFLGVKLDHESGWAASNADGVTYGLYFDVVYDENPEMCQFQFLAVEDMAVYSAKVDLQKLIEEGKAAGVSTADAEAVVANNDATLEEVNAAIEALKAAINDPDRASRENPINVTDKYITPSVPLPNNYDGWTMKDADGNEIPFECNYKDGENIGEFWGEAKGGYSISYTIKNLPAGIYNLQVEGWTRTGMTSILRAGDNELKFVEVGFNSRPEGRKKLDAGDELKNNLMFVQDAEGDVEISLTADSETGDHWTCWSAWRLIYYGNTEDDYKVILDVALDNWEKEFLTTDEETGEVTPKKPFTQAYFDAVNAAKAEGENATTKEEVLAARDKALANIETLRENIKLYETVKNRIDVDGDPWGPDFGGYTDFVNVFEEIQDIFANEDYTKTNEELQALLERYDTERQNAINALMNQEYGAGDDVSYFIKNRHFKTEDGKQSSFNEWTVASSNWFENNSGALSVVEQWANSSTQTGVIDVYQKIAPPKVGVYVLKSKGWYRSTNIPVRRDNAGYNTVNTFLYGASSEAKFHDIYDHLYTPAEKQSYFPKGSCFNATHTEDKTVTMYGPGNDKSDEEYIAELEAAGHEYVLPQNPKGADELFSNPEVTWYDMECRFLGLGSQDSVKIGVRGRDIPPYAWLIWDDFELVYEGDDLSDMAEIASIVASEAVQDLDGYMSKTTKDALQSCIDGLENPESVEQLTDSYRRIDGARDAARASKKLYAQLADKKDNLETAMFNHSGTATAEAYSEAESLLGELEVAIEEGSIEDEDVPAMLKRIDDAIAKLRIPDTTGASDSNPIDFTGVIINPKYFDANNVVATWDGWTGDESFRSASGNVQSVQDEIGLAEGWARSFDLYQDLKSLPEGTYEVRVKGLFNQNSFAKEAKLAMFEFATKNGNEDKLSEEAKTDLMERASRAKFYANNDSIAFAQWNFMGTDKWTEDAELDFNAQANNGDYTFTDSITIGATAEEIIEYYFPQNRASAYVRFSQGYYENVLHCYVDESGELRIGACNKAAEEKDWATFTDWRLFYLGTESAFEEGTGIRELDANKKVVEAIYTVDGRKVQKLQKGMNIVVINGKARKIMVK